MATATAAAPLVTSACVAPRLATRSPIPREHRAVEALTAEAQISRSAVAALRDLAPLRFASCFNPSAPESASIISTALDTTAQGSSHAGEATGQVCNPCFGTPGDDAGSTACAARTSTVPANALLDVLQNSQLPPRFLSDLDLVQSLSAQTRHSWQEPLDLSGFESGSGSVFGTLTGSVLARTAPSQLLHHRSSHRSGGGADEHSRETSIAPASAAASAIARTGQGTTGTHGSVIGGGSGGSGASAAALLYSVRPQSVLGKRSTDSLSDGGADADAVLRAAMRRHRRSSNTSDGTGTNPAAPASTTAMTEKSHNESQPQAQPQLLATTATAADSAAGLTAARAAVSDSAELPGIIGVGAGWGPSGTLHIGSGSGRLLKELVGGVGLTSAFGSIAGGHGDGHVQGGVGGSRGSGGLGGGHGAGGGNSGGGARSAYGDGGSCGGGSQLLLLEGSALRLGEPAPVSGLVSLGRELLARLSRVQRARASIDHIESMLRREIEIVQGALAEAMRGGTLPQTPLAMPTAAPRPAPSLSQPTQHTQWRPLQQLHQPFPQQLQQRSHQPQLMQHPPPNVVLQCETGRMQQRTSGAGATATATVTATASERSSGLAASSASLAVALQATGRPTGRIVERPSAEGKPAQRSTQPEQPWTAPQLLPQHLASLTRPTQLSALELLKDAWGSASLKDQLLQLLQRSAPRAEV